MASLNEVFNHLVLPPMLPGREDGDTTLVGHALLQRLLEACNSLSMVSDPNLQRAWNMLRLSLETCRRVNNEMLDRFSLETALRSFVDKEKHLLICYMTAQNAALKSEITVIVFEAFEAAPLSQDVLATPNALRWQFPSRAVQIPAADFDNVQFQSALGLFLDKAGAEQLSHLAATAHKAGKELEEIRNSGSPALITHMLLSVLTAIGGPADVPFLDKRVHDDVCFSCGEPGPPWRRSPFWLVLRVAAQRQLSLALGDQAGRAAYKLLITTVLSNLLSECVASRTEPTLVSLLQKKICRRLAKLEEHPDAQLPEVGHLLRTTHSMFQQSVDQAQRYVEHEYSEFKKVAIRKIPPLPRRIPRESGDLRLSLPASGAYLNKLLASGTRLEQSGNGLSTQGNPSQANLNLESGASSTQIFTRDVLRVSQTIKDADAIATRLGPAKIAAMESWEAMDVCTAIYGVFTSLVGPTHPMIEGNPGHNSRVLLSVFELWVAMDVAATTACPLLKDYRPFFDPDILNVLQLPSLDAMKRLRLIQNHLERRCRESKYADRTIFSQLDRDSFGTRYVKSWQSMTSLQELIQAQQEENRRKKTKEWERACRQYDQYSNNILAHSCRCTFNTDGTKNINSCVHCFNFRKRRRLTIDICEDLLPKDEALAAAIVFELSVPEFITKYRSMTWTILTQFAYPKPPVSNAQPHHLKDHEPLATKFSSSLNWSSDVSLASLIKSVKKTHYKKQHMKVKLERVLMPLASNFCLFDSKLNVCVSDFNKPPTLAHWCGIHTPGSLAATVLPVLPHPAPNPDGPSSYETVASRPECPQDMSVHEFEAFQRLLSGNARRWLTMLTEMGSSNINFSKLDTMLVFTQLANQAGPMHQDDDSDESRISGRDKVRGVCHSILTDSHFVRRLLDEMGKRLASIRGNWRETNMMEVLMSLAFRIFSLATDDSLREAALALIHSARSITLAWIRTLRMEIKDTEEAAHRVSMYAFKAALACRHSFSLFTESTRKQMSSRDVSEFLCASMVLQQNLVVDIKQLPSHDQNAFRRDCVLANDLKDTVRAAIASHLGAVERAVSYCLGFSDALLGDAGCEESFGPLRLEPWQSLGGKNDGWMTFTMRQTMEGNVSRAQRVDIHYTDGHLLVDGKTSGKLPQDIRDSEDVKELFGNRHLLTCPSHIPGMSYRLMFKMQGRQVHFGRRDGRVIIMTWKFGVGFHEFVPRHIFISPDGGTYDLPRSLVDGCVHWYGKQMGQLECRRKASMWKDRGNDWKLDVRGRQARRNDVYLVDPHSLSCKKVAAIFNHFDDVQRLVVFQPVKLAGALSVELRHLDLAFFVNDHGCLECRQLHTEVDPNQDAGTIYGFQSMIVMRDVLDRSRRSIITPIGNVEWSRLGAHFVVRTVMERSLNKSSRTEAKNESYARFVIDDILGRLTCPPEPLLLYSKVLLHAFTSCPLPDPLTGRTGEEEAVHTLTSGRCQPWTLISNKCGSLLGQIGDLAPIREFYPKDKRVLQEVKWAKTLPADMQRDRYGRLIRELRNKYEKLSCFTQDPAAQQAPEEEEKAADRGFTLQNRGEVQRLRLENPQIADDVFAAAENKDLEYKSWRVEMAGKHGNLEESANAVYEVSRMLRDHPTSFAVVRQLPDMMKKWPLIGGFQFPCDTEMMSLATFMDSAAFGERWGGFVELARRATPDEQFNLMLSLGLLAFAPGANMDAIRLLAAYSYLPSLQALQPPRHRSYSAFILDEEPDEKALKELIAPCYTKYVPTARSSISEEQVRMEMHDRCCAEAGAQLAAQIVQGWPTEGTPSAHGVTSDFIHMRAALKAITPEWERLCQNRDLSGYVARVTELLVPLQTKGKKGRQREGSGAAQTARKLVPARPTIIPSLSAHLVSRTVLPQMALKSPPRYGLPNAVAQTARRMGSGGSYNLPTSFELRQIVGTFLTSPNTVRQAYARDLKASLDALDRLEMRCHSTQATAFLDTPSIDTILRHITHATDVVRDMQEYLQLLFSTGSGRDRGSQWLQCCGLWPRLTPITLLELLQSSGGSQLSVCVKETLTLYGTTIAGLQRLHRVRRLLQRTDMERAMAEWQNCGHENWKPVEHTDWLLMEIDSDFLIRAEQVEVAQAIIAPDSQKNSVLQLNMGKGKTSCIVPMAMAVLADGQQLARLIVPKALLLPTAQTVQSRLGGLVGRELRHVPFSRRNAAGPAAMALVQTFKEHHEELMHKRGILLAAPEHILAFKLSGLQCLADGKTDMARDMISFQAQLTRNLCRDVLDESDFTLAVRTQLVYPSGQLSAVDGAPHRWKLMQTLLSLVEDKLPVLSQYFPHSIRVEERPNGGFPMIYILNTDIGEMLHQMIVDDISRGRMPFFRPAPNKTKAMQAAQETVSADEASRLIARALDKNASDEAVDRAAALFYDAKVASDGLLLIRGLLANSILLTCLKKRWNVQYGLHPKRWPIAVPYEAKGVPSERSEFGHPDVAILFTCLAFYYSGLTVSQLREGLQHILQHTDDPATEYERWTSGAQLAGLSDEVKHWDMVNVDDDGQVDILWKHLRMTRPVIDHYLNTFVFPVHARQFSIKLQASAWDLPLFSPSGKSGARTTGFSGTNDNKMMLPLTIKQEDLPGLRQTNAEVLTYLLQPRNCRYVCTGLNGHRWSELELIGNLASNGIRVLIDAGAYILEKNNEDLARAWLNADSEFPAAVYFGEEDNRAWVLFRDATAKKAPLVATPFVDRLDECLIYFDEAHTRGVDLQLPPMARGALTLALGQTKDHTVQAAMRLRQLGTTQSVVFYAPPEVDQSIRDLCQPAPRTLTSRHVITWLLEQTCQANEQLHTLYLAHGRDFCRRSDGQWTYEGRLGEQAARKALLEVLEQPERQTLAQLYDNSSPDLSEGLASVRLAAGDLQAFASELWAQKQAAMSDQTMATTAMERLSGGGTGAFEEVEQEREIEVQVEHIRIQAQGPQYTALSFLGNMFEICIFVQTGVLLPGTWRQQVFSFVAQTNTGRQYGVRETNSRLFVTAEFGRTAALQKNTQSYQDDLLRPVEWMLWCPSAETGLVVTSEELELVLKEIRASQTVHLVAYSAPVTRAMIRFGSLQYFSLPALPKNYTFPSWLVVELGILAGRLYMTFDECTALGEYVRRAEEATGFCGDAVGFLLEWLSLRRVGQDMMHTPAAYVCQGRPLRKDHAFFSQGPTITASAVDFVPSRMSSSEPSEEGDGESEYEEEGGEEQVQSIPES